MGDKTVTVYSIPGCPWCRKAKEYLGEKGLPFIDYDVAEDHAKLEEMVQLTGQHTVPVVIVDSEIIVGFDEAMLDEALAE